MVSLESIRQAPAKTWVLAGGAALVLGLGIGGAIWSDPAQLGVTAFPELPTNATKVSDTTVLSCAAFPDNGAGGGWVATGTVHNSTGSERSYLISIGFSSAGHPVGYSQSKVNVAAGASAPWSAPKKLDAAQAPLTCSLLAVS